MKKLTFFIAVLYPGFALANAGSPFIWFSLFHLVGINAIIGVTETSLLNKFWLDTTSWKIIIANYVSMLFGFFLLAPLIIKPDYGRDISISGPNALTAFVISLLVTLIIEYPFYLWALKDKSQAKRLWKPFILVNLITNLIMAVLYYLIT